MKVQSVIRKGSDHPVFCEDFLVIENTGRHFVGVVFDGCSGGRESHFASSFMGKVFRQVLNNGGLSGETIEGRAKDFMKRYVTKFFEAKTLLELEDRDILATFIMLIYDKVHNENIFLKKGYELWKYDKNGKHELMTNFQFPNKHIITQMDDILIVIGQDDMYKIFLDNVGPGMVVTEHIGVFGKGFSNHNGFIHNSAGKQNIFYNSGKNISIVPSPVSQLNGVYQDKNVGMIQYMDKKKVRVKFFKIDGLKIKISNNDQEGMNHFAYFPNDDSNKEGILFVPADDKLLIYRTNDFEQIGEMNCGIISSESVIQKCNAGIVAWDGNTVALLNKI